MEDTAQISKDISHSFYAETFVLSFYLTAILWGEEEHINLKVSILI